MNTQIHFKPFIFTGDLGMLKKHQEVVVFIGILALLVWAVSGFAQDGAKTYTEQQYKRALNMLDPRPYDPGRDPDIDMYMNSWTNSMPYNTHGTLVERAILTHCEDPLDPPRKGAVLKYANHISRAILDTGNATIPTTLDGEQEVFYFTGGAGVLTGGGKSFEVRDGILALVPEGLEFTIKNTGDVPLIMYVINEPVPDGFRPNDYILVKDEYAIPYRNNNSYLTAHWIHNGKGIFTIEDGLATIYNVNIGTMNAMTIGHAHAHGEGIEEVWTVVKGRNLEQLGREIRWMEPGTGFIIPPTGETPHSHINTTQEPVKFFLFARGWGGEKPPRP